MSSASQLAVSPSILGNSLRAQVLLGRANGYDCASIGRVAEARGGTDSPVLVIGPAAHHGEASWVARKVTGEEPMLVEPVRSWYQAHERAVQDRCPTVVFDDSVVVEMAALGCGPQAAC